MTKPITDEELALLRRLAEMGDWCARCMGKIDWCARLSSHRTISIRSILARIDAAEGR